MNDEYEKKERGREKCFLPKENFEFKDGQAEQTGRMDERGRTWTNVKPDIIESELLEA